MPDLSRELHTIAQRVAVLEAANSPEKDDETLQRYYYGKGGLDYRDKLMEVMGALPKDYTAMEAFQLLLGTYPDDYPGK